jgi:hypothetical protein
MKLRYAFGLAVAGVLGAAAGFIMSTAGTGLAMRQAMDLRDEQRDRMAAGLQAVIDTAAQDLADMQAQVTDLTAQLEARKPKDVSRA